MTPVSRFTDLPPTPGGNGLVSYGTNGGVLRLDWPVAGDDWAEDTLVQYKVIRSSNPDIETVADAERNGQVLLDWTPATNVFVVPGGLPATVVYFKVLARDAGGLVHGYPTLPVALDDTEAPKGAVFLALSNELATTARLVWSGATDNVTPSALLRYTVHVSTNLDMSYPVVYAAELVGQTTRTVNGLAPGRDYFFRVIVLDANGNVAVYPVVHKAPRMYWVSAVEFSHKVYRAKLDGSGVQVVVSSVIAGDHPQLAIDPQRNHLYIPNTGHGNLHRYFLDGAAVTGTLSPPGELGTLNKVRGAVYDTALDRVFFSDYNNAKLCWFKPADETWGTCLAGGSVIVQPAFLAVEPGATLYWTDSTGARLSRVTLDGNGTGSAAVRLLTNASGMNWGLAYDGSQPPYYLYYRAGSSFSRVPRAGGSASALAAAGTWNEGLAVDRIRKKLYWCEGSSIRRANLDGTNPEDVLTGLASPCGLILEQ